MKKHSFFIIYNKFLRNIIRFTNEDFFDDDELRSSLLNHITPFLSRFENNMQIEKSELNNVKDEFPYAYDLAVAGLSLPELAKYHITEAENSYFALHLQLSLEKRKENKVIKYNILIYSRETSGIYYMMSYKFNYYFGEQIREIVFASFDEMDQYDENDFDLVFKTADTFEDPFHRAIMISPYMNSEDIETVRIAFKKLQSIILDTIMFVFKTADTFEDPFHRAIMISPYMNSEDIETVRIAFKKLQSIILDTIMFRKYLFFDLNTKAKEETIRQMIDQTKAYIPLNENFF